jgi:hypothetical protein
MSAVAQMKSTHAPTPSGSENLAIAAWSRWIE